MFGEYIASGQGCHPGCSGLHLCYHWVSVFRVNITPSPPPPHGYRESSADLNSASKVETLTYTPTTNCVCFRVLGLVMRGTILSQDRRRLIYIGYLNHLTGQMGGVLSQSCEELLCMQVCGYCTLKSQQSLFMIQYHDNKGSVIRIGGGGAWRPRLWEGPNLTITVFGSNCAICVVLSG